MIYDTRGSSARDCFPLLLNLFFLDDTPLAATSVFNDVTENTFLEIIRRSPARVTSMLGKVNPSLKTSSMMYLPCTRRHKDFKKLVSG